MVHFNACYEALDVEHCLNLTLDGVQEKWRMNLRSCVPRKGPFQGRNPVKLRSCAATVSPPTARQVGKLTAFSQRLIVPWTTRAGKYD